MEVLIVLLLGAIAFALFKANSLKAQGHSPTANWTPQQIKTNQVLNSKLSDVEILDYFLPDFDDTIRDNAMKTKLQAPEVYLVFARDFVSYMRRMHLGLIPRAQAEAELNEMLDQMTLGLLKELGRKVKAL